jgi:hypothetical protein
MFYKEISSFMLLVVPQNNPSGSPCSAASMNHSNACLFLSSSEPTDEYLIIFAI